MTSPDNRDMYVGQKAHGLLNTIAVGSYADGDYFTLLDGSHTVKFEPRAKARGTVTCLPKAEITDNQTLIIPDGVHTVTLEAQVSPTAVAASGSITCPVKANLLNNEHFVLNDGVNAATTFSFKTAADAYAAGTIACVAKALLLDHETFTLNDGVNAPTVFEFQKTASAYAVGSIASTDYTKLVDNDYFVLNDGVHAATTFEFKATAGYVQTGTRTTIDIIGLDSDALVADAIMDAIAAVGAGLAITASAVETATVPLTNDAYGAFNTSITNGATSGALTVTGMAGGAIFTPVVGRAVVDLTNAELDTAGEVAIAVYTAINTVGAGLAITAAEPEDEVVHITNDVHGAFNATITDTVADAGFTHAGMTGGSLFVTASVTAVDVSALGTAAEVAGAVRTAINNVAAGLAITAGAVVVATVPLTNDAVGAYNAAITDTVADAGFTHAGMASGVAGFTTAGGTTIVDLQGAGTAQSVALLYVAAINGIVGGLTVTAGAPIAGVFDLTNDATGSNNVAITGTIGFTVVGMLHGLGGVAVSGAVPVDMTGLTTAAAGAGVIATTANGLGTAALNLFCAGTAAGAVNVLNNAPGEAGNVALTENVTSASFTVSGMTGGVDSVASDLSDLNALTSGQTPKKDTDGGFSAATLDNVPDSSTRKAVTAAGATAANALAGVTGVTGTAGGKVVLDVGATLTNPKVGPETSPMEFASRAGNGKYRMWNTHSAVQTDDQVLQITSNLSLDGTRDILTKGAFSWQWESDWNGAAELNLDYYGLAGAYQGRALAHLHDYTTGNSSWKFEGAHEQWALELSSTGALLANTLVVIGGDIKLRFLAGQTRFTYPRLYLNEASASSIFYDSYDANKATIRHNIVVQTTDVDCRITFSHSLTATPTTFIDHLIIDGVNNALLVPGSPLYVGTLATVTKQTDYSFMANQYVVAGYGNNVCAVGVDATIGKIYAYNWAGTAALDLWLNHTGGNIVVGSAAKGASANKCLVMPNTATSPSASANAVHIYCLDLAADRATLALWTEEALATETVTSNRTLSIYHNGAAIKLCAYV